MPLPLRVRLLERINEVDEVAWDALVGEMSTPFVEWGWLSALEQAGCVGEDSGWIPRHITLWRGDRLVAAAPAYVKVNSEGEFVFDQPWATVAGRMGLSYYPKLIVAVPFTPATGDRILAAAGEDAGEIRAIIATVAREVATELKLSSVHLLFARATECTAFEASGYALRLGVQFHWSNPGYTSFDEFLATFSAKKRHQLRRERRLVAERGITVETRSRDALDEPTMAAAWRYYVSTVDKYSWGRRYLNRAFFDLIHERWGKQPSRAGSSLEVVVARRGDVPIAGAINISKRGRLYGRYWGADEPLDCLHFEVCYYHSIEECIARKFEAFEPGAGGEHKARRGFSPTVTMSAHWIADGRLRGMVYEYLERERAQVRAFCSGREGLSEKG